MAGSYADQYLEQYWPERPNNPDMWQDNLELLQAYVHAADLVLEHEGRQVDTVDISTGPCLAPLMATMHCIENIRLSDFSESNREEIERSPIGYWREYAKELAKIFPDRGLGEDALLGRLDDLRRQTVPLDVDLRRTPMLLPDVVHQESVELLTMHFVADSICETSEECFNLLQKSLKLLKPNGWLLLSALIESDGWQLGDTKQPSPNLAESQFDEFFEAEGFEIISRTRSVRKEHQIYDGGWTVFLARKVRHTS